MFLRRRLPEARRVVRPVAEQQADRQGPAQPAVQRGAPRLKRALQADRRVKMRAAIPPASPAAAGPPQRPLQGMSLQATMHPANHHLRPKCTTAPNHTGSNAISTARS